MKTLRRYLTIAGAALLPSLAGCWHYFSPLSMGVATPVPVPAWVTERMQEKYNTKNDYRTPIMPPILPGAPAPMCEDYPDEAQVVRALPKVRRGEPYIYEEFRDDIQVVSERLVDRIDPPRFFPLVGPAQLHHCHFKCTVYYTETFESGYPFPFRVTRPRIEVVYIDKDHLHVYNCPDPMVEQSMTRDVAGP
jgi:hypothetical protein